MILEFDSTDFKKKYRSDATFQEIAAGTLLEYQGLESFGSNGKKFPKVIFEGKEYLVSDKVAGWKPKEGKFEMPCDAKAYQIGSPKWISA